MTVGRVARRSEKPGGAGGLWRLCESPGRWWIWALTRLSCLEALGAPYLGGVSPHSRHCCDPSARL